MSALPIRRGFDGLSEYPDSPQWDFDEITTCTRRFHGPRALVWACTPNYGQLGTGAQAGMTVRRARSKPTGDGSEWELTIVWEGSKRPDGNPPEPPQPEFAIEYDVFNQGMMKHPRWILKFTDKTNDIGRKRKEAIYNLLKNPPADDEAAAENEARWIYTPGEPNYDELVHECYRRMAEREMTFKCYVPTVRITSYTIEPPQPSAGGFIQNPPDDIVEIPQSPWGEWVWIRNADRLSFNRSWWMLTQSWTGRPWEDEGIYSNEEGEYE